MCHVTNVTYKTNATELPKICPIGSVVIYNLHTLLNNYKRYRFWQFIHPKLKKDKIKGKHSKET